MSTFLGLHGDVNRIRLTSRLPAHKPFLCAYLPICLLLSLLIKCGVSSLYIRRSNSIPTGLLVCAAADLDFAPYLPSSTSKMPNRNSKIAIAGICIGLTPALVAGFITSWSGPVGRVCIALVGTVLFLTALVTLLATVGFITEWFDRRLNPLTPSRAQALQALSTTEDSNPEASDTDVATGFNGERCRPSTLTDSSTGRPS